MRFAPLCLAVLLGAIAGCDPPPPTPTPAPPPAVEQAAALSHGVVGQKETGDRDWYWQLRDVKGRIRDNSAGYESQQGAERGFHNRYPDLPIR